MIVLGFEASDSEHEILPFDNYDVGMCHDAKVIIHSISKDGACVSGCRKTADSKRPARSIPDAQRKTGINTPGLAGAA